MTPTTWYHFRSPECEILGCALHPSDITHLRDGGNLKGYGTRSRKNQWWASRWPGGDRITGCQNHSDAPYEQ